MKTMTRMAVLSALASSALLTPAGAQFSAADQDFLLMKCQIFKDDLAIVKKLSPEVQARFAAWVAARDPAAFTSFKNTRNYCKFMLKLLNPTDPLPFARPPADWNEDYLLPDELARYRKVVAEHAPCKDVWLDPPVDRLTAEQKEILRSKGNLLPEDIELIPRFTQKTQDNIVRWLTTGDLRKLIPFKSTRDYYRKLLEKPGKFPLPPATWDYEYLTPEEFCNYSNMLDNAPW